MQSLKSLRQFKQLQIVNKIHPSLIDEPTLNVEKFRLQKSQKQTNIVKILRGH